MALNWDIGDCENWEQLKATDSDCTALDTVIMMTMSLDIGHLTEKWGPPQEVE